MALISPTIFDCPKWKRLKGHETTIILYLLVRANQETLIAYPAEERMAKDCGISTATVGRALKRLTAKKAIQVDQAIHREMRHGRNTIKKNNSYNLSTWRRFCYGKKESKKAQKSVQNDPSQLVPEVNDENVGCAVNPTAQAQPDLVNDQNDSSQNEDSDAW